MKYSAISSPRPRRANWKTFPPSAPNASSYHRTARYWLIPSESQFSASRSTPMPIPHHK